MIIAPIAERLVKNKGTVIESNETKVNIFMSNQCLCDSFTEAVEKLAKQVTNRKSTIYHTYAEKEKQGAKHRIFAFHEIVGEQFEKQAEVVQGLLNKIFSHFEKEHVLIVELLILNVDINQNISSNINNKRHTFFTKFSLGLSRFRG